MTHPAISPAAWPSSPARPAASASPPRNASPRSAWPWSWPTCPARRWSARPPPSPPTGADVLAQPTDVTDPAQVDALRDAALRARLRVAC